MSETVMFAPKKYNNELLKAEKQKGISVDVAFIDEEELENPLQNFGASLYTTFFNGDSLNYYGALSMSFGKGIGADVTLKILPSVYFSAGWSYPVHTELALPVKILQTQDNGISIAPVFRQQVFHYENELDYTPTFQPYKSAGVKTSLYSFAPMSSNFTRTYLSVMLEAG
ncbi:MAG: hypothetical protein WD059_05905 [Balneolaceae bacterium]